MPTNFHNRKSKRKIRFASARCFLSKQQRFSASYNTMLPSQN
ncbi:MAG: hypothetical protein AVDCRST_MAG74-3801 [uncultured Pyrinomonadaceae bacterium]|uniref:Uncharacterized protein n=1 Tax=uncultured Pyrinomonadaceae bacterium TaxID=2283094 RepID=A0A6J4Q3P0_9BACT|nr:MAG: hypothetical protein AVDCRST_MAG74-3801 [uncultured Pyrinomonadaceae bacterium]